MSLANPSSTCPSNLPVLRFSPLAWYKLQWFCHQGDHEIGGWGVARNPARPLEIHDLLIPKQICGWSSVEFDMDDVARSWLDLDEKGLQPYQYSSVWIHTHPGSSAQPSNTDEETFAKHVGPWSIMFILAKGGHTTCRLKVKSEGGLLTLAQEIPVQIDWNTMHLAGEQTLDQIKQSWEEAYQTCIQRHVPTQFVWERRTPCPSPQQAREAAVAFREAAEREDSLNKAYEEYYAAKEQEMKDLEDDFRTFDYKIIS